MAAFVNDDVWFSVDNGGHVDLSDYIKSGQLTINKQIVDVSVMGVSWIQRLGGIGDWKIDLEFIADYDNGPPERTWYTLYDVLGVVAECVYLPNGSAAAPANPKFTGNAILGEIPIGGSFSELATFNVTFECSGALGVAYA